MALSLKVTAPAKVDNLPRDLTLGLLFPLYPFRKWGGGILVSLSFHEQQPWTE